MLRWLARVGVALLSATAALIVARLVIPGVVPPPRWIPPTRPLLTDADLGAYLVLLLVDDDAGAREDAPELVRRKLRARLIESLLDDGALVIAFAESFSYGGGAAPIGVPSVLNDALGRAHAMTVPVLALKDGAPALPWCKPGGSAYCLDEGLAPSRRFDVPTLHMDRCTSDSLATLPHALGELAAGRWLPGVGKASCKGAGAVEIRPPAVPIPMLWASELLTDVPFSGQDPRTTTKFVRQGPIPQVKGRIVVVGDPWPMNVQADGTRVTDAEVEVWAALSMVESPK